MRSAHRSGARALGIALALALAACATAPEAPPPPPEPEGFLGDYTQLRPSASRAARSTYFAPDARWRSYTAVWIESVTLWADDDLDELSARDRQLLADHLYASLREALVYDYRMVRGPGPGVIRLRAALSETKRAAGALDTVTRQPPMLRIASTLGSLEADDAILVGKAALELELADAVSGERLAAVVDEQIRTLSPRGGIGTWRDVKRTFDAWADRLRERLAELRSAP